MIALWHARGPLADVFTYVGFTLALAAFIFAIRLKP